MVACLRRLFVCSEGDMVEVQLSNSASSMMPHSIDFHAAAVPMGGSLASETPPTRTSTFQFRALRSGIYLYHCGSQPVDIHLAKGMYGLVLVGAQRRLTKSGSRILHYAK